LLTSVHIWGMSEGCVLLVRSEVFMTYFQAQRIAVGREECCTLHMGSTQNTDWRILFGGLLFWWPASAASKGLYQHTQGGKCEYHVIPFPVVICSTYHDHLFGLQLSNSLVIMHVMR